MTFLCLSIILILPVVFEHAHADKNATSSFKDHYSIDENLKKKVEDSKKNKSSKSKLEVPVEILSINKGPTKDKWIVQFQACAIGGNINNPDFVITSDLEKGYKYGLKGGNLYRNECSITLMALIKAKDPTTIKVAYLARATATDKPFIKINDIVETRIPGKFDVIFQICAGKDNLIRPEIVAKSDIETENLSITSNIGKKTCLGRDIFLHAKDESTIKIEFKQFASEESVESIKKELEELKKQLKGKKP